MANMVDLFKGGTAWHCVQQGAEHAKCLGNLSPHPFFLYITLTDNIVRNEQDGNVLCSQSVPEIT